MIPRIVTRPSGRARAAWSPAAAVIALVAVIGSLLASSPAVAAVPAPAAPPVADAAHPVDSGMVETAAVVGFNAENIISDALFYDGSAMTASEIQAFLDAKIGACTNGKCLNVLSAGISSRAAVTSQTTGNLICSAIQGGTMKVSELIYRVQVACGVSAKVILVTLQKEQGLTTSKAPSDWNLSAAMGASCPDTAPCDPAFAGVGPQILKGTQQLKTYKAANFAKQPGVHYIAYSPSSSCGGSYVNIQNYATAALYNYTPYQPNGAALAAGYGLGDSCSAYGNRNFYNYYTSWFGSTQAISGAAAIAVSYAALGGSRSWLGSAIGEAVCGLRDGGCYQDFQNGKIHWSGASGAHPTRGGVQASWAAAGWENGSLGYPTSGEVCGLPNGGCYQDFQNGTVYWSPATGAHPVLVGMLVGFASLGYERGSLGYPTGGEDCSSLQGVCQQTFQGGLLVWTAGSGAHVSTVQVAAKWIELGGDAGRLGRMTGNVGCYLPDNGCYQDFAGGKLYWTQATGAQPVIGGILAAWAVQGYERGALGYPTSGEACGLRDGGCYQDFQNGKIYWSGASGAHSVRGEMLGAYLARGGLTGALGYPLEEQSCASGTCLQRFEGGHLP